ncbi:hypothetical protein RSO01_69010 [Reyranella soli]|uniref:Cupin type-2 domain-containing protein n=2 Tax=Reyranella soli TaxID=1230389 RepID=A0A512NLB6_9HYPH|nr:hypothetical protein RSO01_69010 [Reyranella soli]
MYSVALSMTTSMTGRGWFQLSLVALVGICAVAAAETLDFNRDAVVEFPLPLCTAEGASGSSLDKVEIVRSYALPDIPGKRVTVVRVTYGPGGFTPPHRHGGTVTAYITKGQIKSQLKGGPLETYDVGQSFFEPPGAIHLVSANASNTEWAELIAIVVADDGAQLTTLIDP